MEQYIVIFNRIAECVTHRCTLVRRDPELMDLVDQLAIRSEILQKATVNVEIAALRKIFKAARFENDGVIWPSGITPYRWLTFVSEAAWNDARASLKRQYSEIRNGGPEILAHCMKEARDAGHDLLDGELMDLLAGKKKENKGRVQKEQRYLRWRDLSALEAELSQYDPLTSLDTINAPDSGKASLEGTLRLFINTMWFTGMRPQEVWNCVLMVPRTDIAFTTEMAKRIRMDPYQAIMDNLMMKVEEAHLYTGETLGLAARNAMERANAPCILVIRSAKTTNQNTILKSQTRLQILTGVPQRQLNMIAIASQTRRLELSEKRKDNIRSSLNRILREIKDREPTLRDLTLNLYSFRHSFVTRAKLAYPPHETAALTGHTSRNSIYHYGQRNKRNSGNLSLSAENGSWLPAADPVTAANIKQVWERSQNPTPEAAPA